MPITRLQLKCCCLSWCIGLAIPPVIIIMGRHQEGVPAARRPLPEWGGG